MSVPITERRAGEPEGEINDEHIGKTASADGFCGRVVEKPLLMDLSSQKYILGNVKTENE